jgi:hypothetical protein
MKHLISSEVKIPRIQVRVRERMMVVLLSITRIIAIVINQNTMTIVRGPVPIGMAIVDA